MSFSLGCHQTEKELYGFPFSSCDYASVSWLSAPVNNLSAPCLQESRGNASPTLLPTSNPGGAICSNYIAPRLPVSALASLLAMRQRDVVTTKLRGTSSGFFNDIAFGSDCTSKDSPLSEIDIKLHKVHYAVHKESLKRPLTPDDADSISQLSTPNLSPVPVRNTVCASVSTPSVVSTCSKSGSKSGRNGTSTKTNDGKWMSTLDDLKAYKRDHGDCIVPRGYTKNPRLASWVAEQRKQFKLMKDGKASSITPERILMLDSVGFSWNAQDAAWDKHMSDLKAFRLEHGHCHVPLNNTRFPKLGLWVKEQRRHYSLMKQGKQSHMTEERVRELGSIDFCWDTHEATWLERLRELMDFKEQYGSCFVPSNYDVNPKLGTWVHHQRRQYRKWQEGQPCHITPDRVRALVNIGFVWKPRDKKPGLCVSDDSSASSSESDYDIETLDLRPSKRQRSL